MDTDDVSKGKSMIAVTRPFGEANVIMEYTGKYYRSIGPHIENPRRKR